MEGRFERMYTMVRIWELLEAQVAKYDEFFSSWSRKINRAPSKDIYDEWEQALKKAVQEMMEYNRKAIQPYFVADALAEKEEEAINAFKELTPMNVDAVRTRLELARRDHDRKLYKTFPVGLEKLNISDGTNLITTLEQQCEIKLTDRLSGIVASHYGQAKHLAKNIGELLALTDAAGHLRIEDYVYAPEEFRTVMKEKLEYISRRD